MNKFFRVLCRWVQFKYWEIRECLPPYCPRCTGCGEPGCCSPQICDNGAFCSGYYGDRKTRLRMVEEWEDQ